MFSQNYLLWTNHTENMWWEIELDEAENPGSFLLDGFSLSLQSGTLKQRMHLKENRKILKALLIKVKINCTSDNEE